MFCFAKSTVVAGIVAALSLTNATAAVAGQCSAAGTNPLAGAPTMPKGVTDSVIGSIDLAPEINVPGRQLRTRRLVVAPGGIVPMHSHKDRPALIVTVSGSITEHRSDCSTPITHKAGDISREADGISHYWVNRGKVPAVLLSSDVFNGT